ncbi:MAG TPA: XRE family transcriptional regulator [Chloroflexota bacterium]|nr:XRE family transcriptional regulator [Chloroflexota bacterium]
MAGLGSREKRGAGASAARGGEETRLGLRVRSARERAGVTLREVARRTGLSPSFLSQLERDQVSPSIASLKQVATALGIRVADVLAEASSGEGVVVRRAERPVWKLARARYEQLSPSVPVEPMGRAAGDGAAPAERRMQPQLITFEPGGSLGDHPVSHEGEEFGLVLSGRVECAIGEEVYLLEAGDSVCFDARRPHHTRNAAEGESAYLLVVTPPTF